MTASAPIEGGRIHLPNEARWLADFEHEIVTFPNARHDDQVDALSQFVIWLRERGGIDVSVAQAFPGRFEQEIWSLSLEMGHEGFEYDGNLT